MSWLKYRGRPAPLSNTAIIGEPLWTKCECGGWVDKDGKHVEAKVLTWSEILEKYGRKCKLSP